MHDYLKLGLPTRVEKIAMQGHNQIIFPTLSKLAMQFPGRGEGLPPVDLEWTDGADIKPEVDKKYWNETKDGDLEPPKLRANGQTLLHRKDGKFLIARASHGSPSRLLPNEAMREHAEHLKQPRVGQNHQQNFVQACLGEGKTTSPFRISGELTQLLHLGVACQYLNDSFDFDPETKRVIGNAQAQAVLDGPEPRTGWEELYRPVV